MSKVVKGVGRAISNVVKGVTNVVKQVTSSKIGKVLLTAAAVYFGGAALAGAFGGASAGTGIMGTLSGALEGAASGIGSAWSGLTGAGSALMSGNMSGAASSVGSGFTGAYSAGESAASGALGNAASGVTAAAPTASAGTMANGLPVGVSADGPEVASYLNKATSQGIVDKAINSNGFFDKLMNSSYGPGAMVMGGTQLIGGAMQGYGADQQQKRQYQQEQAARDRYNTNIGTRLWR